MPKRIQKFFLIMTALVSLVFIFSCSTGDKTGVERTSITDVITGGESVVGPSGTDGTGGTGGTGGSGACVQASTYCYQGSVMTESFCTSFGTFYAGQSCTSIGYSTYLTTSGGVAVYTK